MIVIDTHVLVWWLAAPDRLSAGARKALRGANARTPAVASAISVLEIATAARRGRLMLSMPVDEWLHDVRLLPEVRIEPVTAEIAQCAGGLDDTLHGDPADRIIVATARTLGGRTRQCGREAPRPSRRPGAVVTGSAARLPLTPPQARSAVPWPAPVHPG